MTSLVGKSIALSVSDAPDRHRLGLPAREVDRALFSICTALVRAGAKIVYAGDLDPNGLTFSMFRHLTGAYASSHETPFVHIVPEAILRALSFEGLLFALREGAAVVETRIHIEEDLFSIRAVEDGLRVGKGSQTTRLRDDAEFKSWLDARQVLDDPTSYSAARKAMTALSDGRVLLALEAGMPLIPLGAFGGAARDVAIALDLLPPQKRVPRGAQSSTYEPAMKRVAGLRDRIPAILRPALAALADDDRGEAMAYDIAGVLERWLS